MWNDGTWACRCLPDPSHKHGMARCQPRANQKKQLAEGVGHTSAIIPHGMVAGGCDPTPDKQDIMDGWINGIDIRGLANAQRRKLYLFIIVWFSGGISIDFTFHVLWDSGNMEAFVMFPLCAM